MIAIFMRKCQKMATSHTYEITGFVEPQFYGKKEVCVVGNGRRRGKRHEQVPNCKRPMHWELGF